ncbi:MAG: ABC transporter substrate-binding protein, partial [Actinobacteria bacterium]|nr:ABC transporter substrate-binding protein [Actinomycetota bacterium]
VETSGQASDINSEGYFFNLKNKQKNINPLEDINIRKAIFHAIDRKRIVDSLLGKYGEVLNSLFKKDSIYYSPAWDEYNYDVEKAKSYLKIAGYDNNNPLYLIIGANADSQSRKLIIDYIKEDLDKIGIKIWVTSKDSKQWYLDYVKNGNFELGLWALYTPDTDILANYFNSNKIPPMETEKNKNCNNFYWYSNPKSDELLNKLYSGDNGINKVELSAQLQKTIAEDAVILPLFSRVFAVAYNKKIQNIDLDTVNGNFLKNIEKVNIVSDPKKDSKEDAKSIIVGYEQEPYTLNPFISDSIYKTYITGLVVKGLWELNQNGDYTSLLVDKIVSGGESVGGKTAASDYLLKQKIKLKDKIFWQDGTPITAQDVVATINAIKRDESIIASDERYKNIKEITAIDSMEFSVTFNEYDDNWKDLFKFIFPEKMLKDNGIGSIFENDIFGSGPYKLKEWVKGEYILLERNDYYSGEKPKIDSIKFIFNSDINYLINMLRDGTIDILSIPSDLNLMEDISSSKDLGLIVKQGDLWEHLAICLKPKEK